MPSPASTSQSGTGAGGELNGDSLTTPSPSSPASLPHTCCMLGFSMALARPLGKAFYCGRKISRSPALRLCGPAFGFCLERLADAVVFLLHLSVQARAAGAENNIASTLFCPQATSASTSTSTTARTSPQAGVSGAGSS